MHWLLQLSLSYYDKVQEITMCDIMFFSGNMWHVSYNTLYLHSVPFSYIDNFAID